MKKIISGIGIVGLLMFAGGCKTKELTPAQKAKIEAITEKIDSRNFTFVPTSATPLSFRSIPLTGEYSVRITNDSVISDLPYFGRGYVASLDPTDIGVKFVSTDFDYSVKFKKDLWEITVIPKDSRNVERLFLSVGNTGYTTLSVQQVSRQSISYYGTVE